MQAVGSLDMLRGGLVTRLKLGIGTHLSLSTIIISQLELETYIGGCSLVNRGSLLEAVQGPDIQIRLHSLIC